MHGVGQYRRKHSSEGIGRDNNLCMYIPGRDGAGPVSSSRDPPALPRPPYPAPHLLCTYILRVAVKVFLGVPLTGGFWAVERNVSRRFRQKGDMFF